MVGAMQSCHSTQRGLVFPTMEQQRGPSGFVTRWSKLDELAGTQADDAWRWFIDRYRPFARSVLSRILKTRGRGRDLEAAVEEFWAYLFSSNVFASADRGRRFRSFLAGTLHHFVRDYCRKNRHMQSEDEEVEIEPASVDALPETEELRLFAHQVLRLALAQLEANHSDNAKAVRWFYGVDQDREDLSAVCEPLSVAEIAERLGIKSNAVHQVLHRGRKRLRVHIEAELKDTVTDGKDLDEEVRTILEALAQGAPGLSAS